MLVSAQKRFERVAMARGFDRYKREAKREVRLPEVKENETLKQLKAAWKIFTIDGNNFGLYHNYDKILSLIRNIGWSAKDVEQFSLMLIEFQNEPVFHFKAGLFLSALINESADQEFIIHTTYLEKSIYNLGTFNKKIVRIKGDAGKDLGELMQRGHIFLEGNACQGVGSGMRDGLIEIEGNVEDYMGHAMKGGIIVINGNATFNVGDHMKDGMIIVRGNADIRTGCHMAGGIIKILGGYCAEYVGRSMRGGRIYVEGDSCRIDKDIFGGEIFHKGKLVWSKSSDSHDG